MSPANGASKVMQNRPRPAVAMPKGIVPALPLSYGKIQQKKLSFREKPKETIPPSTAPAIQAPINDVSTTNAPLAHADRLTIEDKPFEVIKEPSKPAPAITADISSIAGSLDGLSSTEGGVTIGSTGCEVEEKLVNVVDVKADDSQEEQHSAPSETQSTTSRSTYQMPPPFVPASNQSAMASESTQFPQQVAFNGQHPMHHAHPSSSTNPIFGGYPDSNNSSPAPPSTASNIPPYAYAQQGGMRHGPHLSNGGHQHHMPNGFSPMTPAFPPGYYHHHDTFQVPPTDEYLRRQVPPFNPSECYSPTGAPPIAESPRFNGFDPASAHNVHASRSSAQIDQENGLGPHYGHHPSPIPPMGPPPYRGVIGYPRKEEIPWAAGNRRDLWFHLREQFAQPEFSDCVLELRYTDDRAPPLQISGHRLIFARSLVLKGLITSGAQADCHSLQPNQNILIESDDRYLRSDAFSLAVRYLYGGPILDLDAMARFPAPYIGSAPVPSTPAERFNFTLGYVASGVVLQIPQIWKTGCSIASQLITWDTAEKALEFALEGGIDWSWSSGNPDVNDVIGRSIYSPCANMLIYNIINLIILSFPPNFELDTTVSDPLFNSRIPYVPDDRPTPANPRLSSIKFGDHPTEESFRSPSSDPITTTLSRLLLNLPFGPLKHVLETGNSGLIHGQATHLLRRKIMYLVIEERERRRQRAFASKVPHEERVKNGRQWNAVGWKEAVLPFDDHRNEEVPCLRKTWVGFTNAESN
ncbi:hypothetical protein MFRU_005g04080 [Monilinia fructicola]|uniref:Uncharacterized protein n=1 Tax=Monilinia fructicola TaxID=38448 RepID=A0A5M9JLI2_MONFR|nr:hypothetical protein EYC84_002634 [Monilinia fructicola]KAG4033401.1 hypothetical protein MFRU_005g04080 [Monilinia fructicola]